MKIKTRIANIIGVSDNFVFYVRTDAGNIPYFYLSNKTDIPSVNYYIEMLSTEYFAYFRFDSKPLLLDKSQKDEVYRFMMSKPDAPDSADTNWQLTCKIWNICNPEYCIPENLDMPDYRQLKE